MDRADRTALLEDPGADQEGEKAEGTEKSIISVVQENVLANLCSQIVTVYAIALVCVSFAFELIVSTYDAHNSSTVASDDTDPMTNFEPVFYGFYVYLYVLGILALMIISKTSKSDANEEPACNMFLKVGACIFALVVVWASCVSIWLIGAALNSCFGVMHLLYEVFQVVFVCGQLIFIARVKRKIKVNVFGCISLVHLLTTNICVCIKQAVKDQNQIREELSGNGTEDMEFNHCHNKSAEGFVEKMLGVADPFATALFVKYSSICAAVIFCLLKELEIGTLQNLHADSPPRSCSPIAQLTTAWGKIQDDVKTLTSNVIKNLSKCAQIIIMCTKCPCGSPADPDGSTAVPEGSPAATAPCKCPAREIIIGFIFGVVYFIGTVGFLAGFYVCSGHEEFPCDGLLIHHIGDTLLYSAKIFPTLYALIQISCFNRTGETRHETLLDGVLMWLGQIGQTVYCVCALAAISLSDQTWLTDKTTPLFLSTLVLIAFRWLQSASQTVLICLAQRRECPQQRMVFTFLFCANIILFAADLFETFKVSSNPVMGSIYHGGPPVLVAIYRASIPVTIFYRFHSAACFFELFCEPASGTGVEPTDGPGTSGTSGQGTSGTSGQGTSGTSGQGTSGTSGQGTSGTSGQGTPGTSGQGTPGASGQGTPGTSGQGTPGASGQCTSHTE